MPYIAPAYNPDPQVKPPFPCAVDWNHPLSRGLVGCWLMNEGGGKEIKNLVDGIAGTFVNNLTWKDCRLDAPANTDQVNYPSSYNLMRFTSEHFTILSRVLFAATYLYASPLFRWVSPSAGYFFGTGSAATKLIYAQSKNITTSEQHETGNVITPSTLSDIAFVRLLVSGVMKGDFYVNGNPADVSRPTTYSTINYSSEPVLVAPGFKGTVIHTYVWSRALTPSEIQSLYLSPYQFIRPVVPMPYWIAAAAPAAGIPTHMDYYRRMRMR